MSSETGMSSREQGSDQRAGDPVAEVLHQGTDPPQLPFSLADLPWRAIAEVKLHPTQIMILETLAADPTSKWSPTELHDEFDMPLGVISYHTNVLDEMALIKMVGTRQVRGANEHFYRIIKDPTPQRPKPKDKQGRKKN